MQLKLLVFQGCTVCSTICCLKLLYLKCVRTEGVFHVWQCILQIWNHSHSSFINTYFYKYDDQTQDNVLFVTLIVALQKQMLSLHIVLVNHITDNITHRCICYNSRAVQPGVIWRLAPLFFPLDLPPNIGALSNICYY